MMIRAAFPAAALLLALAACVSPPAETPPETPVVAKPAPAAVEVVIEPPPAPEPVVTETETEIIIESAVAALTTPEPEPEPEPPVIEAAPEPDIEPEIDDDPEQLMGLAGLALAELLGDPGFLREDADAQVWQYRGQDCMLDIYLYRDGEGSPHLVTYYEFRGESDERPCLRELLLN